MMRAILLFLLCAVPVGLALTAAAHAADARVLVVGDSLSDAWGMPREAGWVYRLEQRLQRKMGPDHTVINGAISGETTAGAAARIHELLAEHDPDVVLIILGGNDGLRGLNPARVEENLDVVLEAVAQSGARGLLMQIRMPPNLGRAYVRRFEGMYPRLAERHGAELLPFFMEDLFDRPGMLAEDGIHPTEAAQPALLEAVWPAVGAALEVP